MGDFRDQVREKLVTLYEKSPEDLCRVLHFLDKNDKDYHSDNAAAFSPYWKSLKALINSETAFKQFAQRLVNDTKTAEENPQFVQVMHDIYDNWMVATNTSLPAGQDQGFDMVRLEDVTQIETFGFAGLARAWDLIPDETKGQILALIPTITRNNRALMTSVDECVSLISKTGGKMVMYGLAAVYLGWEALKNIRRWWNGEISGKRCVKNVVDVSITTAAGVGGGVGGAALGTAIAGPVGTIVGGILGGIVTSSLVSVLVDRLTQYLFDLPKSEALEQAYNYLGVGHSASNAEVNTAFRRLCLKHHPDKGGDQEEFFILQNYMAVIKLARGEP